MRGLKPGRRRRGYRTGTVASFTDAWIETIKFDKIQESCNSRIFYRCVDWNPTRHGQSPAKPSRIFYRCVDWNLTGILATPLLTVASFTDAWIETGSYCLSYPLHTVASFTDAWIETLNIISTFSLVSVASFTDAWIETTDSVFLPDNFEGRIFYRCVDWNNKRNDDPIVSEKSHLLQMRGLKLGIYGLVSRNTAVASFTDAWIETRIRH